MEPTWVKEVDLITTEAEVAIIIMDIKTKISTNKTTKEVVLITRLYYAVISNSMDNANLVTVAIMLTVKMTSELTLVE